VGTAHSRPDPAVQGWVMMFSLEQYARGRFLRELAEPTDRSFPAVGNILDERGVKRQISGAAVVEPLPRAPMAGAPGSVYTTGSKVTRGHLRLS
jgi:hypothetical protein